MRKSSCRPAVSGHPDRQHPRRSFLLTRAGTSHTQNPIDIVASIARSLLHFGLLVPETWMLGDETARTGMCLELKKQADNRAVITPRRQTLNVQENPLTLSRKMLAMRCG